MSLAVNCPLVKLLLLLLLMMMMALTICVAMTFCKSTEDNSDIAGGKITS
jgi:hypothetical protein